MRRSDELLDAAREGDEDAYRALVEPHRAELHAHCYRMLGSVHDAEDALQEALLRAWRGLPGFEGRSSMRALALPIATNTSLRLIERRGRRACSPPSGPSTTEDRPARRVALDRALPRRGGSATATRRPRPATSSARASSWPSSPRCSTCPPRQRAALILREVLGFSAQEVADALETTVPSVNSALQRARRTLDERLPERSQQTTLRALGDERTREIVQRYVDALERADVDAVLAMLAEDATWSMPPIPDWYRGHDAIAGFLRDGPLHGALAPPARARQRPARRRLLPLRDERAGALRRARRRRAHARRHDDRRRDVVRRSRGLPRASACRPRWTASRLLPRGPARGVRVSQHLSVFAYASVDSVGL